MKRFLTNKLNQVLVLVLTIAALMTGQTAAAQSEITHDGQSYYLFDTEDFYTATSGSIIQRDHLYPNLVDNAFDGKIYTYWQTDQDYGFTEKFIEFFSEDLVVPKGYRLRTSANTKGYPNRRPKSWTLKARKHDHDAWIVLATVTDDTQLPADDEKVADYWLTDNTAPYKYFRFEITDIHGSEEVHPIKYVTYTRYIMELADLQLIGDTYDMTYDLDYAYVGGLTHNFDYTGQDIIPDVTVYNFHDLPLTEGRDYTLTYTFNDEPVTAPHDIGRYTAIITAIPPYVGQICINFQVVEALLGEGTEENPYLISSANDWYLIDNKYLHNGHADAYYKLADDFDNSKEPITEMTATSVNYPFRGTFDGNGRTLHIALKANSDDGCAPFRYLKAATIQNLTVAGYVANFLGNGGKLMELDTEGEYATNRAPAENGTSQTGFDPATGTLRLYFKEATEIKAGTPYIIKWPNGGNNLTDHKFQSVKIDNSDATLIRQSVESADGRVLFSGTFSPVELPVSDKSNLFFASGNEDQSVLGYPTDGNNDDTANPKYLVKSFRAFFHVDLSDGASINAIELHAGDETTGVKNVQCSMFSVQSSDAWFDLQGRRLAGKPSRAGAYINNGKKIVIK